MKVLCHMNMGSDSFYRLYKPNSFLFLEPPIYTFITPIYIYTYIHIYIKKRKRYAADGEGRNVAQSGGSAGATATRAPRFFPSLPPVTSSN